MKLIGVARVSTAEQAGDNGEGLARQEASLRRIAQANGVLGDDLQIVRITDVSGSDVADSKEWREVIRPRLGDPDVHLALDAIDRLIRMDSKFDLRVLSDLQTTGTIIYTPAGRHDLAQPNDVLITAIFGAIGGFEKAQIKRRMMGGKEAKRQAGCWVSRLSGLPLGISYDRETRTFGYTPQITLVKEAFRLFVDEGLPLGAVARRLGLRGKSASAKSVLGNPIYAGWLVYDECRGAPYPSKDGKQPQRRRIAREVPIRHRVFPVDQQAVTDAVWENAQNRIREVNREARHRRERTAPGMYLSGLMYSAHEPLARPGDGLVMLDITAQPQHVIYGEASGSDRPIRYACRCKGDTKTDPNAPRPRCELHYLHADDVNRGVDQYLHSMTHEAWAIDCIRKTLRGGDEGEVEFLKVEMERMNETLRELDKREARLTRLHLDGRINPAAHDKEQDEIRHARATIEAALVRLNEAPVGPTDEQIVALARAWLYVPSWDPTVKRAWILKYVRGIFVSNRGVESVVLRLPGRGDCSVTFSLGITRPWTDLLGYDPNRPEARLAGKEGRLVAGEVAARLGITPPRLHYLVKSGTFPPPTGAAWGLKRTWTEMDVAVYRRLLPSVTDRRCKAAVRAKAA